MPVSRRVETGVVALGVILGVYIAKGALDTESPYKAASRAETAGQVVAGTLRFIHRNRHGGRP